MLDKSKQKQCSDCGKEKFIYEFHRHNFSNDGYSSTCIQCRYPKKGRYFEEWITFFEKYYGNIPICGICKINLNYTGADKRCSVRWDHRRGGQETIKGSPNAWYRDRTCNESNQKIWLEQDFGILCDSCNKKVPTCGREEWVQKLNQYVFNKENLCQK